MTSRTLTAISALALTLSLSATTLAVAASSNGYRIAPPPSNPRDVFRTIVKVPPLSAATAQASTCDCPPMGGPQPSTAPKG